MGSNRKKGVDMKLFACSMGLFFFAFTNIALAIGHAAHTSSGPADDEAWDLMITCEKSDPRTVFSLYRDPNDTSVGILYNYPNNQLAEHMVDISYTNAGARAIVTSKDLPTLIFMAYSIKGPRFIQWNGVQWFCPRGNF
jgi:hypothetical protein